MKTRQDRPQKALACPTELLEFLKPYGASIRDLTLQVRSVVLDELAPCHEYIWDAYSAVALGYGPTPRLSDGVCHVAVYSAHVNIGFNCGVAMADPAGVLRGSGKAIRHITIKSAEDLAQAYVRDYLRRARELACDDEPWPAGLQGVTTVVKGSYARKRRPRPQKDS